MTDLVVRDLPEEIEQRLKRRAERHGRSLEAEVQQLLAEVPDVPPLPAESGEGWATRISRRMKEIGITNEDIDELERVIAESRERRRARSVNTD